MTTNQTTPDSFKDYVAEVLKTLYEAGHKPEQVQLLLKEWIKIAHAKVYSDLVLAFTDQELEEAERVAREEQRSKEEMQGMLKDLYIKKTGKNPADLAKEHLNTLARAFMETYDKNQARAEIEKIKPVQ